MKPKRKPHFWLAIAVAALCAGVLAAAIVVPRFIDSEAVRSKITTMVARQVGGTADLDSLELDIFPLPGLRLHGLDVAIPGTGRLRAASLWLTPRILPLLTGDLRFSRVKLDTPLVDIERPTHAQEGQKENEPVQSGKSRATAPAFLSDPGVNPPDMTIVVQNGRFNLLVNGTPLLQVEDIDGTLVTSPEGLAIDIACRSNVWEPAAIKAKLALSLSGRPMKGSASPRIVIEANIPKNDLKVTREATLKLFGDIPLVKTITDVVQLGTATDTIVRLQGDSWTDLGVLNSFYLQGGITGGHIVVPGLDLDLKQATGEVTIADGVLACKQVNAAVGSSTLSDGSLTLGLAGGDAPFHLEADIQANLKELPAVLEKAITDKAVLDQVKAIAQIDGQAQGKLILGERIRNIRAAVEVNDVQATIEHSAIPYPVTLTGGRMSLTENRLEAANLSGSVGQTTLTYTDVDVKLQDAAFHLSGSLAHDSAGITRSETTLSGRMGPDSVKTLSRRLPPSPISEIRSPLEISGAHVLWEKEAFTLSGDLQIAGAPTVTLDLHQAPGNMNLRLQLTSLGERMAESTLAISDESVELAFNGEIDGATIAKLVITEGLPEGQLRGDFKARMVMDQPDRSTADGRLEIKNMVFPWSLPVPVSINGAVLTGKGGRLIVENADIICQEQQVALQGEIGFGDNGVQLAMNLAGDGFDLTPVVNAFAKEPGKEPATGEAGASEKNRNPDQKAAEAEELPLSGTIHVDLGHLTYDRFVWKPFRAGVALRPGGADVTVKEAVLCNLAMPGKLTVTPREVAVDFSVSAENQEVRPTHQCLLGPDYQATGTLDLEGVFKGRGKLEDLAKSIEGKVTYVARDGRIYKDFLFQNILAFLDISGVFAGNLPHLAEDGFAYHRIEAQADIKSGKILLNQAVMDGSALNLALEGEFDFLDQTLNAKGVVWILKTVSRVLNLVPIAGERLSDRFTGVPFQATGSWGDPQVETTKMSSIAPGLAEFRTGLSNNAQITAGPNAVKNEQRSN